MLTRRAFLGATSAALAAGLAGRAPAAPATGTARVPALTKLLDIGPGGVIEPGSAQDLRFTGNLAAFRDTGTPWIRLWADWPSLQPHPDYAPDDPLGPGHFRVLALDAQVRLAVASGLKVMLLPYRFPTWANGTARLSALRDTDAEIAFRPADRMTRAEWEGYVRGGRDPAGAPQRKALEYLLPEDPYGPDSHWAGFFDFLYRRYGRWVAGFELVNEPNLQLWPQRAPAAADPFADTPITITRHVARLLRTAQAISARHLHTVRLFAPSISDSDTESSRRFTRFDAFVPALLDACAGSGYLPHSRQAWSHHNYTDVERRQTATRTQAIRSLLAGRWSGYAEGPAPTVFVTEGGARLDRMPALYPDEEPRAAQARCLTGAWERHRDPAGLGAGVAMLAQYLIHTDPNYDTGLLDAYPSTLERPAYAAWRALQADGATP